MRRVTIGGSALAAVVIAGVIFTPPKSNPGAPQPAGLSNEIGVSSAAVDPVPPPPDTLANVVDVTDIDPLLDPPNIPLAESEDTGPMLTAVGYEPPASRSPQPAARVVPIPPASDDGL